LQAAAIGALTLPSAFTSPDRGRSTLLHSLRHPRADHGKVEDRSGAVILAP
jgi:hypothetical protein